MLDSLSEAKCIHIDTREEEEDEGNDALVSLNLSLISAFYNLRVSSVEFISRNLSENDTYDSLIQLISLVPQLQEECIVRKGDGHLLDKLCRDLGLDYLSLRSETEQGLKEEPVPAAASSSSSRCLSSRKIQILLSSYIRRHKFVLSKPLVRNDLTDILRFVMDLLFAMVDISSSYGWINTCLRIMELSQMFVQAVSSPVHDKLLQLSRQMDRSRVKVFKENGVSDIYDLINMDDDDRDDLLTRKLSLSESEISRIAQVCNDFPIIEAEFSVVGCRDLGESNKRRRVDSEQLNGSVNEYEPQRRFECGPGSDLTLSVNISRDFSSTGGESDAEEDSLGSEKDGWEMRHHHVCIVGNLDYYPLEKEENWWVILIEKGDPDLATVNEGSRVDNSQDEQENEDRILGIRRIQLNKTSNLVNLKFSSAEDLGVATSYKLLVVCDSYIGCDQEFTFSVKIVDL